MQRRYSRRAGAAKAQNNLICLILTHLIFVSLSCVTHATYVRSPFFVTNHHPRPLCTNLTDMQRKDEGDARGRRSVVAGRIRVVISSVRVISAMPVVPPGSVVPTPEKRHLAKKKGLPQAILKAHDRRTQPKAVPIRQSRPMSRLFSHLLACCMGFCTSLNFFLVANFCFLFYDEANISILTKLLRCHPGGAAGRLRRKEECGSPWKKASPVIPLAPE